MNGLPRLYAIADATFGNPVELARALIEGGARLVQLRDKGASSQTLLREADEILALARGAALIVNDRADVALIAGATGVHLGQTDLPPVAARRILTSGQIIGCSTHNLPQALAADRMPVDYIAAGPIFPTSTKSNPDPVIGLSGLSEICSRVSKPVVAIGGITLQTAEEVLNCGAASVAVVSDLLRSNDVVSRTRDWVRQLS